MPHVEREGVRIWFEERGKGPALVLLQGLSLSSRFWMELPNQLEDQFRIILIDNRGTGRSDRPRGSYAIRTMARDVLSVADVLGLDRFAVAGISMGGMIAQEVALAAGARVSGLALLATTCGLPGGKLAPMRSVFTLLGAARRTPEGLKRIRGLLVSAEAANANPELFRDFVRLMAENPTPPGVFLRQLFAAGLHSTARRLGQVRCPTLVVSGDQDQIIPVENSRVLARRIPGARLVIVPGAGHAFPLERKELLRGLFSEFFASV